MGNSINDTVEVHQLLDPRIIMPRQRSPSRQDSSIKGVEIDLSALKKKAMKKNDVEFLLEVKDRCGRLEQTFTSMCRAHAQLDGYKKTSKKLLELCTPYARMIWHLPPAATVEVAKLTSRSAALYRRTEPFRRAELRWYETFLSYLREWSSWDILTLLVRRDRVKAELEQTRQTIPRQVLLLHNEGHDLSSRTEMSISHAQESIEALKVVFSSKEHMKMAMRLRGPDAQSFLDLLDQTMDKVGPTDRMHGQCLHVLRKLCARSSILPTSCTLRDSELEKISPEPLASGGFADVWLGAYQGRPVALKVIRRYAKSDITKVNKSFCREAILWRWLSHPNIVPFWGVSMTLFSLCMVCEWMENGNIATYVDQNPRANRLELLVDVAKGLRYLHCIGVVHGDLKGANILIDDSLHARLSDFGLTAVNYDVNSLNAITTSSNGDGSVRWMAPELINPEQADLSTSRPSIESDIYALGMVIFEVFSGCVPFHEHSLDVTVILNVMKGSRPARPSSGTPLGLSDSVWRVAEACWQADRGKRPDILSVLECLERAWQGFVPPSEQELSQEQQDPGSTSDSSSDYETATYRSFDFRYSDL